MRKALLAITATAAVAALGFAVAGLASSSSTSQAFQSTSEETNESTTETAEPTSWRSVLNTRAEVPKPAGVKAAAAGTFNVTVTEKGDAYSGKYSLSFRNLTGKAVAAHIHRGKPGKAGPVVLALCGPCTSGKRGTASISNTVLSAMKAGNAYVNVHTAKNKAGEIRGQVTKVGS